MIERNEFGKFDGCTICIRRERFNDINAATAAVSILLRWGYTDFRPCDYHRQVLRVGVQAASGQDPGLDLVDLPLSTGVPNT